MTSSTPTATPERWAVIEALQNAGVDFQCRMTLHGALQSPDQVITVGRRLADKGVRRFSVKIARSDQILNESIDPGYPGAEDKQRVLELLTSFFETLDIRE
ncbi:MAG: hypothetical protein R6W86_11855 [Marinobacter sp.]|uniref:hypothetical protein n=1 Tax=Marinobacter sp. TaxID=50741 RepID=UPI00396D1E8C